MGQSACERTLVTGDLKAEHHPALGVLGDVAVGHPQTWICDVQQDVHDLACAHEHSVLPHKIGFRQPVPAEDQETAGTMNVEGVVHRVIGFHFVDQSDLHPIADSE